MSGSAATGNANGFIISNPNWMEDDHVRPLLHTAKSDEATSHGVCSCELKVCKVYK